MGRVLGVEMLCRRLKVCQRCQIGWIASPCRGDLRQPLALPFFLFPFPKDVLMRWPVCISLRLGVAVIVVQG